MAGKMKSRALGHTLLFALVAFAYSWAIFFALDVWFIPTFAHQFDASLVAVVGMFGHFLGMAGPALAAFVMWRRFDHALRPVWKWSHARYYFAIAAVVLVLRGVSLAAGAWEAPNELAVRNPFASYLWLILIGGLTLGWLAGMGEELGWCAYLLPLLAPSFGKIGAVVISGIVRGLWHLPVVIAPLILVASQNELSLDTFGANVLTITLALALSNILFGAAMGWLWFKTASVPLVGWAHQCFDVARDFGILLLVLSATNGDTAALVWSVGIHLIGLGALGWLARQAWSSRSILVH
jgi:membrane protease YdiL (CAAX protease family)